MWVQLPLGIHLGVALLTLPVLFSSLDVVSAHEGNTLKVRVQKVILHFFMISFSLISMFSRSFLRNMSAIIIVVEDLYSS